MLACAYILASTVSPIVQATHPPQTLHMEDLVPDCDDVIEPESVILEDEEVRTIPTAANDWPNEDGSTREWTVVRPTSVPPRDTFEQVLELYTTRRMKPIVPRVPAYRQKLGVSIPSQRRWLHYWSQFLASGGHPLSRSPQSYPETLESGPVLHSSRRVRVTRVVVRMRELSGVRPSFVQAMSLIKQTANWNGTGATSGDRVWASVARYDDDLVDMLENCEESSRLRASESPCAFKDDKWDRNKMVRKFASISTVDVQVCAEVCMTVHLTGGRTNRHFLLGQTNVGLYDDITTRRMVRYLRPRRQFTARGCTSCITLG